MKRLSALFLSLAILFFNLLSLSSCREDEPPIEETLLPEPEVEGGEEDEDTDDKLKVPLYKDYERGTVDFSAIVYSRPKTAEIIEKFNTATDIIAKNALSYEEQLSSILALEEDFNHFLTMYTYADIKLCQDSSDEYWVTEQAVTRQDYPAFSKAVEDLFVAAARSPHAERFEADYFGDGLIFEYADGGDYTDALVALLESEAQLESEYSAISTASVTITYMGKSDTLDNILAEIEEDHGKGSTQYSIAKKECARLYEKACAEKARYIYVELIKLKTGVVGSALKCSYERLSRSMRGTHSEGRDRGINAVNTCLDSLKKGHRTETCGVVGVKLNGDLYGVLDSLNELECLVGLKKTRHILDAD